MPSLALCGLQAPCTITAEHADAIEVSMAGMAPQMVVARDEAGRFTVLLTPTVGHAGVPLTCTCVPVCGQVRGELVRAWLGCSCARVVRAIYTPWPQVLTPNYLCVRRWCSRPPIQYCASTPRFSFPTTNG